MAGHVFISYSRLDQVYVQRLVGYLRSRGLTVWIDSSLEPGTATWARAIESAIEGSVAVVAVMSTAAAESVWVDREIDLAQELRRPIIPLHLSGRRLMRLRDIQSVDVTAGGMPGEAFAIRLLALAPPPAPPPAPPVPMTTRPPAPQVTAPAPTPLVSPTRAAPVPVPALAVSSPRVLPSTAPPSRPPGDAAVRGTTVRRRTIVIAVTAVVVVTALAVILLPRIDFGGTGTTPGPTSATSNPAAAGTTRCVWTTDASGGNSTLGQPPTTVSKTGHTTLTLTTNRGEITIDMDRARTPCTVASLAFLTGKNYYAGSSCQRLVIAISSLQCGDPTGTGTGTPGYQFADENLPTDETPPYHAGDVAMANLGTPGTNGSQFFIVYDNAIDLDADYPIFGHVVTGLDVIKAVAAGGDDGAFAAGAGGGHPKLPLTFSSVKVS